MAAGDLPDYTYLWWDLRPHPRLGTVEVRAMDAQTSLSTVAGLAALVQGLAPPRRAPARRVAARGAEGVEFRAARDGLGATLLHDGALRPVPEIGREALARASPFAEALGSAGELEEMRASSPRAAGRTASAPRTPGRDAGAARRARQGDRGTRPRGTRR